MPRATYTLVRLAILSGKPMSMLSNDVAFQDKVEAGHRL